MSDRIIRVKRIERLSVLICVAHTGTKVMLKGSGMWKVRGRKFRKDRGGLPLLYIKVAIGISLLQD